MRRIEKIQRRRAEALARTEVRMARGLETQLFLLDSRPGQSERERARLEYLRRKYGTDVETEPERTLNP